MTAGKRTFLFFILSVSFLSAALCGCAPTTPSSKQIITVWHWMTDRRAAFEELAARYEAQTGIKVNFELYAPSEAYSQKVRAAAQGANLPDIFGILGEKRDFASFIKAGYVFDLTAAMEANKAEWRQKFFEKALAVNEFVEGNSYGAAPGIYGVPLDIMTIEMLFNKDLFKQLGLDPAQPPKTFEGLLAIGKKIKEAGLQGMVSGWGEVWMVDCFASNYAFNIMGQDKVLATLRGEVPYTDPDWVRVLTLFKEMQESGLLASGLVTMVNKDAEQQFANGNAVFAFNGSWCVNVYKSMNPTLNYAVMLPPQASGKYPMKIWGGAGSSFMVSAQSKNRDAAVGFLRWLSDNDQQAYLAEVTNNLPANRGALKQIPNILAQFADDMDATTHPNIWGVSEFSAVIEAFDKGIQSIIIGEKTPEEIAAEVQKIKERELNKRARR